MEYCKIDCTRFEARQSVGRAAMARDLVVLGMRNLFQQVSASCDRTGMQQIMLSKCEDAYNYI